MPRCIKIDSAYACVNRSCQRGCRRVQIGNSMQLCAWSL